MTTVSWSSPVRRNVVISRPTCWSSTNNASARWRVRLRTAKRSGELSSGSSLIGRGLSPTWASAGPPSAGMPEARRIWPSKRPRTSGGRAGVLMRSCLPLIGQETSVGSSRSRGQPEVGRDRGPVEEERFAGAVVPLHQPAGDPPLDAGLVVALVGVVDGAVVVDQHVVVLVGAARVVAAVRRPVHRAEPVGPTRGHVAEGRLAGDLRGVGAVAVEVLAEEQRVVAGRVEAGADRAAGRRARRSRTAARARAPRCCARTAR